MGKYLTDLDMEKEVKFKFDEDWCFQRKIILAPDLILLNILGRGNRMNENVRKDIIESNC